MKKRLVTLMIVFAMLLAAVPAFADVTAGKAGEFPITSEKVTFDVWIEGGSDTDWSKTTAGSRRPRKSLTSLLT